MKRLIVLILAMVFFASCVMAGSVGISPAYYVEHFEPNLERIFSFRTFNPNLEDGVAISLGGDLAPYANLSNSFVKSGDSFKVFLKLPGVLNKPGEHNVLVIVKEARNESSSGGVGGVASIRAPIRILVPYPGQYIESGLRVNNINKGELAEYDLNIQNLGTEDVILDVFIEVFEVDKVGKSVLSYEVEDVIVETKKSVSVSDSLETSGLEAGDYYVEATIAYSNKTDVVSDSFRVGEFLVDIIDYDYMFEKGRINQFDIMIGNKWNTRINSVYADVVITDEGEIVSTFKTVSVDTKPWEVKNITGFFDATEMEVRRYLASIDVYYEDSFTHKLVAIYIEDPPKERSYLIYALVLVGALSLSMFVGFAVLVAKLKKLKGQVPNGKKRK